MADGGDALIGALVGIGGSNPLVQFGSAIAKGIRLASSGRRRQKSASDVVGDIFQNALNACGTAGQVALIQEIGIDGFEEGFNMGLDNGRDASGVLSEFTNHPEAIGDILEEAEGAMTDVYQQGGW